MAWTAPMTFVNGSALTAAQLNTHLRDNLSEQAPSKASTPGGYFTTVSPNLITERSWATNRVLTVVASSENSSYDDLLTSDQDTSYGPEVTLRTDTRALVFLSATFNCQNTMSFVSFAVSGASSIDPSDANALGVTQQGTATTHAAEIMCSTLVPVTNLEPGENTFTMKYRIQDGGSAAFRNRELLVMPF